ncbi:hypothetical protein [Streptomyces kebangsaanensis]|uniref:hypothetical protein n=1 Tax=Streptomyces kebangsaanensis TaxID=864058 RepID=UPI001300FCAD|nr:hypothetical protein [Streptomyces kebangsaanensis]
MRIWAAASRRTFSWSAFRAASSLADLVRTAAASGSLWAATAAARFACAPLVSRGIDACAVAIAFDAWPSHFAAPSLKSPSRRAELARSSAHMRNASAPSPFHATHCGRTFSSSAIFRIPSAAAVRRSAAACTSPAFARSSHASICS